MRRKPIQTLSTRFFIDYGTSYENTVFLAGTSRSGTTWMSNVINYNNQYRYMFEPFYEQKVDICKHFKSKQYLRPSNRNDAYFNPTQKILCGKVKAEWVDRFNEKVFSSKRLIKSIRANLFLRWLYINFPNLPIILLLRHPLAVAASKVKFGWKRSLSPYLEQNELIHDFLYPFCSELKKSEERYQITEDSFENHIFSWCIENYVPLKQFSMNEVCIIFYENTCVHPELESQKIFSYLNKSYDEKVLENIKLPSQMSRKDSSIITGDSLVSSWKKHLTDQEVERATEILNMFGLDKLYSRGLMPHVENLEMVMKI